MGEFLWGGEGLEFSVRKAIWVERSSTDAVVEESTLSRSRYSGWAVTDMNEINATCPGWNATWVCSYYCSIDSENTSA